MKTVRTLISEARRSILPAVMGLCLAEAEEPAMLHDPVGRAGMVASGSPGVGLDSFLVAGGANFPNAKPGAKTPEERGAKVYYAEVALVKKDENGLQVRVVGELPRPVAYAAFTRTDRGVLIAGGCNDQGHLTKVTRTEYDGKRLSTEVLPELPRSIANAAFARVGHQFYVIGGQEKPDSTTCLNSCYVLNLDDINAGWKEVASLPEGRMLAAAGVLNDVIYVMGGCSLHADEQGQAERTYLKDIWCYDPVSNTWAKAAGEMPEPLVGMANPLPAVGRKLYVIGGDPGDYYRASLQGKAPAQHPGQSRAIYTYTPSTGAWVKVGELPEGIATFPAVVIGDSIYTVSGEIFPGVRTPRIHTITLQ